MHDDHVLESRNNVTLLVKPFSFLTHCTAVNDIFLLLELVLKNRYSKIPKIVSTCDLQKTERKNSGQWPFFSYS